MLYPSIIILFRSFRVYQHCLFTRYRVAKTHLIQKKRKNDFKAIKFYVDFKAFNHQFQTNFDNSNGIKADVQKLKHTGFSTSLGYSKTLKQNRFFEVSLSFMGTSSHETSRFYTLGDSAAFTVKEKVFQLITGARVEYFFPVVKRADNTNGLYLGLSYEPYIFINKGQSLNTYTYSRDMYVFNNVMAIVPRFTQNITKNVYLDINIPIAVYSIALKHDNWKNPILPIYLRRKTAVESTFLPANYQFRIGLGVKI